MHKELSEKNSIISSSEGKIQKLDMLQVEIVEMEEHVQYTVDVMGQELANKDKNIANLCNQLRSSENELESICEKASNNEHKYKRELQQKDYAIVQLKNSLMERERTSKEEIDNTKQTINKLKKNLEESDHVIKSLKCKCDDLCSKANQDQKSLELARDEINKLKISTSKNLDKCSRAIECTIPCNCNIVIKAQESELEAQRLSEEKFMTENKALREHSMEMENVAKQKIKELSEKVQRASFKCENLENENKFLHSATQQLHDDNRRLAEELKCTSECAGTAACLQKQLDNLSREYNNIEKEFNDCRNITQSLKMENNMLQAKIKDFFTDIKKIFKNVKCTDSACDFLDKLKLVLEKFHGEKFQIPIDNENFHQEIQTEQDNRISSIDGEELSRIREENKTLRTIIEQLQANLSPNDEFKLKLDMVEQENKILKEQLAKAQQIEAESLLLKDETIQLKSAVFDLEDTLQKKQSKYSIEHATLKQYVHDVERCLCAQAEEIKTVKSENAVLRSSIYELETTLKELDQLRVQTTILDETICASNKHPSIDDETQTKLPKGKISQSEEQICESKCLLENMKLLQDEVNRLKCENEMLKSGVDGYDKCWEEKQKLEEYVAKLLQVIKYLKTCSSPDGTKSYLFIRFDIIYNKTFE